MPQQLTDRATFRVTPKFIRHTDHTDALGILESHFKDRNTARLWYRWLVRQSEPNVSHYEFRYCRYVYRQKRLLRPINSWTVRITYIDTPE